MKSNRTVGAGFLVLAVFALSAMLRFVPVESISKDVDPYLSVAVLQLLVYAIPSIIYTRLRFGGRLAALRIRVPRFRHVLFMLFAALAIIFASVLINFGMHTLLPDTYQASSAAAKAAGTGGGVIGGLYAVIAFALIPAVCEEYLFRSIVCAEFECAGVGTAVFFSTVLFAMSHFSLERMPVYLFCGLALVFVFYVTRSVVASAIVHFAVNAVSLFFEELIYKVINRQGVVVFLLIAATAFLIFAALSFGEAERIYRSYAEDGVTAEYRLPKKQRVNVFEALLCPPVLACAVFYIIMCFVN